MGKGFTKLNRLSEVHMKAISNCVLHSLGLPPFDIEGVTHYLTSVTALRKHPY
jgi:hypothetical protein